MKLSLRNFTLPVFMLGTASLCGTANAQLTPAWFRQFPIVGPVYYSGFAGVSSAADGVYAVGNSNNVIGFVVKYDTNGNLLWSNLLSGASCVSTSADGVYVVGSAANDTIFSLRKYDPNGNILWAIALPAYPCPMSASADGAYVAGFTFVALPGQIQSGGADAFVQKYDPNGNLLWTREFGAPPNNVANSANGLSVAADGVYVAGSTGGALPGQTFSGDLFDGYVRKYDPAGNELWTRQFGNQSEPTGGVTIRSASATSAGVYVAGATTFALPGQTSSGGAFVRNYDIDGNELWTREFGMPPNLDSAFSASATAEGVDVLWQNTIPYGAVSFAVSRYDLNGNAIDTSPLSVQPQGSQGPAAIDAGQPGRVYVAGLFASQCPVNFPPPQQFFNCTTGFVELLIPGPVSHVSALPAVEFASSFNVQWFGSDSLSPIATYTIYVSDDGEPFTAWLTQTANTQATYNGVSGHTYGFYSIATDLAGNVELPKSKAEATTLVDSVKPVSHVLPLPATETSPNFLVQWSGTDAGGPGIASYLIEVSDNGKVSVWQGNTNATQAWYSGSLGHTYNFLSSATDVDGNAENGKTVPDATTQIPARMAEDVNGDGQINCTDVDVVKASFGKKLGQPGFNPAADVNIDGVVNVLDLALVTQKLIPGTTCQ